MNKELIQNLQNWAAEYETAQFIESDPIQIPHRYNHPLDIEVSAFVTSWLSWGNREAIIRKAYYVDSVIFEGHPYKYITEVRKDGSTPFDCYKDNVYTLYRTFKYADFYELCLQLRRIYQKHKTLEDLVKADDLTYNFKHYFGHIKGFPDIETKSSCKRLNMFLRWMIRRGPVDFGLWNVDPINLIIPLDTHVIKSALRLGLIKRRTPDMQTALQLTNTLKEVFPNDPVKGDFALFGSDIKRK